MIDVHILANCFYPELPGGPNQYFRYGPFLRERGVQLHVHTVKKDHHEEVEFEVNGIKVTRYDLPAGQTFSQELEVLFDHAVEAIGSDRKKCCIHPVGAMLQSRSSTVCLWKARIRGIPSCVHMMMMPVWESESFLGRFKESLRPGMFFSPYVKVLMCSRVMGRAYSNYAGIPPKRIEAIPNGIDLKVFSPVTPERKRELRENLDLPAEVPIVIYVGSVVPRKGVDILIEAWASVLQRHPKAVLLMVGSTGARPTIRETTAVSDTEQYIHGVFDQVEKLSNPKSVIFAGEVGNVQEFYQASDFFVFASLREGLPSVVMESMACGVPCVTAPFLGLPDDGEEYGVAGEHYVKSSHEPGEMAEDIVRMIEDSEGREEMARKGLAWMRETQDMEKATDRLAEIYHEISR